MKSIALHYYCEMYFSPSDRPTDRPTGHPAGQPANESAHCSTSSCCSNKSNRSICRRFFFLHYAFNQTTSHSLPFEFWIGRKLINHCKIQLSTPCVHLALSCSFHSQTRRTTMYLETTTTKVISLFFNIIIILLLSIKTNESA